MKKLSILSPLFILMLTGLSVAGNYEISKHYVGDYKTEAAFINAIETGEGDWEIFISSLRDSRFSLGEISPPAVSNYMEALANDRMMRMIPIAYFGNESIRTALEVVFESSSNIVNNWSVYEDHWLLGAIERGDADVQHFILTIKMRDTRLQEISPSAVANYMETLANEGMLELIPSKYFDHQEIMTAIDVVFQDPGNIPNNWNVYEDRWLSPRICAR